VAVKCLVRVEKGAIVPHDEHARNVFRKTGVRVGDVMMASFYRPRDAGQFRKAHKLGQLLLENREEFEHLSSHDVLKRLQYEADLECEHITASLPGFGEVPCRYPKSLAFDQMSQGAFNALYSAMCKHISDHYWQGVSPDEVEKMAELMETI